MTIAQLINAAKKTKYLGLRFPSGHIMGVNSKCVFKAAKKCGKHFNSKTSFVSFKFLNMNEYISCNHPFIKQ
ncbi:hypothetical protein [Tenacibaculum xiamenense]|uniref:hypothetical protein n=1 Tax=Tenacibaculum xiamenense TaxID=1261553 RepID=UPI0038B4D44F